jgi:hypothetical protein
MELKMEMGIKEDCEREDKIGESAILIFFDYDCHLP